MPPANRPAAVRGRVFRSRDVIARGLLTQEALRGSAWRRLFRGVYADADLPDTFAVRVAGACLLLPDAAVFSGRTAAFLHGAAELIEHRSPVEVSVPTGVRYGPVTGLRVRQVQLSPEDITSVRSHRCTSGLRTALDIARQEAAPEAVAALDILVARAVVGRGELREAADRFAGRGARKVARAAHLTNPLAESQPESRLRVHLALAGLLAIAQHRVRDADGNEIARVDLAFPEHRVAVEYDGAWHGERGQLTKDRRRMTRLAEAGWRVFHVTAADMRDPAALVARIRAFLQAPASPK